MEQWPTRRIIGITFTVGAVLYLVYYVPWAVAYFVGRVWDVLVVLILSVALAVLLGFPVQLLCRLKVPLPERGKRIIATLLVLAVTIWLGWIVVSLTATQMFHELERLALIGRGWLTDAPQIVQAWLDAHSAELPAGVVDRATELVAQATQGVLKYQFGFAKGALLRGWYLVDLFVIPLLAFYFVTDGRTLRSGCLALAPRRWRSFLDVVLLDVGVLLDRYVGTLVILCIIKALTVGLLLYLCGVNMYLTLAILAGVFRLAPVVGPLVAAVPCVGIPMAQDGLETGLIVLAFYSVLIFVDGKVITPILLGGSATLHPVVVIFSLLIGYEFAGVVGLLIAVPTAGIVRTVYVRHQELCAQAETDPEVSAAAEEHQPK